MLRKLAFHHHDGSKRGQEHHIVEDEANTERPRRSPRPKSLSFAPPANTVRQTGATHRAISNASAAANSILPGIGIRSITSFDNDSNEPLGLHLVCENTEPAADIIFVHGLGGTCRKTWSWDRNIDNFWPPWLAEEEGSSSWRIFTFGYNSHFKGAGTNLNTIDFAKDLLFQMSTFWSGSAESSTPIGGRPIILVAHSMGGLVVKKAYILGKHDSQYSDMIARIYGIIFLATPHRGSQYAKILNNILSTAPLGAPPKAYVADLDAQATSIQDINEQFRSSCGSLALVSFFETHKVGFGVKFLVVEKESAILGYPQEISSPLNGDHHTICKFRGRDDSNYKNVRNVLNQWIANIRPVQTLTAVMHGESNSLDSFERAAAILGISGQLGEDLYAIRGRVMDGTCRWMTEKVEYLQWIESTTEPHKPKTLWLVGLPATGKTVLSSVVIDHIQFLGHNCAHHFFSSGHQAKRTVAHCLRSIAAQLAWTNQQFRERLIALHEESGLTFASQKQDFQIIWDRIFEGIICKMRFTTPLFWVLDAVDEADSPSLLISHLMKIHSKTPIKVFLSTRPMRIPSLVAGYGSYVTTIVLAEEDTMGDIRLYVLNALRVALPDDEDLQRDITDQMLAKASGSFLWVKLALETLQDNWHTEDDIRKALTDIPQGMEDLYRQMLHKIESQSPRSRLMAQRILIWAACSWRPLSLVELEVALAPEFKGFVNLKDTIIQICGQFVTIESYRISIIHTTALQFLLSDNSGHPAFINSQYAHEHIASVCLRYLSGNDWRRVFQVVQKEKPATPGSERRNRLSVAEREHPLLGYSTYYWAYHASNSNAGSHALLDDINDFLSKHCLSWIEAIGLSTNLRYLTRSAQYLKAYAKRRLKKSRQSGSDAPLALKEPPEDGAKTTQRWANDLIRLVGKFGVSIVQDPSSVHRLIPSFCPRDSMIGRTFTNQGSGTISVRGLSSNTWDDCLASVSVEDNRTASHVIALREHFLTLTRSTGLIMVWNAETCEEERRLEHREYVSHMVANPAGDLLATAGIQDYRIWKISSGRELYSIPVMQEASTMAIAISDNETELVVGLDDCLIIGIDLESSQQVWRYTAEDTQGFLGRCPWVMAFSPDLSKVAMAWRGQPPLVWDLTLKDRRQPQHCRIGSNSDAICGPETLVWQKDGRSLLVLCQSAVIVNWHIYDDEQTQFDHVRAREMTVSEDGNLLLTSDHAGTTSIWTLPRANLIYRLINQNAFIRNLAFSPDSQRFYDTRGSLCNVWEPDILVRPDDQVAIDQSSVGEISILTEPVVTEDMSSQSQVTALAPDARDKYYCCGKDDGTVFIHDVEDGRRLRKVYTHESFTSVVLLAWSRSGKYVVSGDETGRVLAKRLESKGTDKWAVYSVLDLRLPESVQQFLFNNDEKSLLISTSSMDLIYDLKTKVELHRESWGFRQSRRWVQHPSVPESLVWIDTDAVHIYHWASLQHEANTGTSKEDEEEPGTSSEASPRTQPSVQSESHRRLVQWITVTQDRRYLLYETLPDSGHASSRSSGRLQLKILSTASLRSQHPQPTATEGMADVEGQIKRLIGTYNDAMIFLDHNHWLCSWRIDSSVAEVKRHFFLPKDWLNPSMLQMATMNEQGTFFCPKHGDVAILKYFLIRRSALNFRLIRFLTRPGHVHASSILSSPRYRSNRHNLFHLVSRPAFTGYWILESFLTQPQPPKTSDITIFYLHGGGYFSSQPGTYLLFLLRLAESILTQGQTVSIFALDYHLAPEHCYPTQLRVAAAAYSYLIKDQGIPPEKIVVAGDSGGAHLALSFLVDLQTSERKASKPAGLVLISPWLSLHHTPSTNADRDCLSASFLEATARRFLGPSFREEEKFSPTLEFLTPQPAIDWDAVLPVWIWVSAGTNEVLFDDIVKWVQGLEDGLGRDRVERAFAEGEVHAWQWLETMDEGAKGRFLEKVGECREKFRGVEQIGRVIGQKMGKSER